jgi:hypothetical protein
MQETLTARRGGIHNVCAQSETDAFRAETDCQRRAIVHFSQPALSSAKPLRFHAGPSSAKAEKSTDGGVLPIMVRGMENARCSHPAEECFGGS